MPNKSSEFLSGQLASVEFQINAIEQHIAVVIHSDVSVAVLRRIQDQYRDLTSSLNIADQILRSEPPPHPGSLFLK